MSYTLCCLTCKVLSILGHNLNNVQTLKWNWGLHVVRIGGLKCFDDNRQVSGTLFTQVNISLLVKALVLK